MAMTKEEDIQMMLVCKTHLGTRNCDYRMKRYVFRRTVDGIHIIHIGKTCHVSGLGHAAVESGSSSGWPPHPDSPAGDPAFQGSQSLCSRLRNVGGRLTGPHPGIGGGAASSGHWREANPPGLGSPRQETESFVDSLSEMTDDYDSEEDSSAGYARKVPGHGGGARRRRCALLCGILCCSALAFLAGILAFGALWLHWVPDVPDLWPGSDGPDGSKPTAQRIFVGKAAPGCRDAPGAWTNGWAGCAVQSGGEDPELCKPTGWTCLAYMRKDWCSNGTAAKSMIGPRFNSPEKTCCGCGGNGTSDDPEDYWRRESNEEALCHAHQRCVGRTGRCCPDEQGVRLSCCQEELQ